MRPMMALSLKIEDVDKKIDERYVMEPKYDGMRLLLQFDRHGLPKQALTRSGRNVLPQIPVGWAELIQPTLILLADDQLNWIDMEFGYRKDNMDIDFNQTMRVMGSGPVEAQRKAADLPLPVGIVFDMPSMAASFPYRKQCLHECISHKWQMEGIVQTPTLSQGFDIRQYQETVRMGYEGVMLKRSDGYYEPGARRANTWYKVKKFETVDAFVTGYKMGTGKYEGQIGALEFSTTDRRPLGYCSGMTDEQRQHFTTVIDTLMANRTVIEVAYYGLTAGTPRHPQFVRLRQDRHFSECSWAEQRIS